VRVVPADPPRYVIRITPSPHCRSTLEAAAAALAALGGARGRAAEAALIRVLEQMVALQARLPSLSTPPPPILIGCVSSLLPYYLDAPYPPSPLPSSIPRARSPGRGAMGFPTELGGAPRGKR
jgi:hypothetical protein